MGDPTQEQLTSIRSSFETGIRELRADIAAARFEASEGHRRLREDFSSMKDLAIEHEVRLDYIDSQRREDIEHRRWFWPQVIAVAAISAGAFMWVADKLIAYRVHP